MPCVFNGLPGIDVGIAIFVTPTLPVGRSKRLLRGINGMLKRRIVFCVTAALVGGAGVGVWSQDNPNASTAERWAPFRVLEGRWEGTGDGYDGRTRRHEQFRLVLGGTFLRITSTTVFAAESSKPQRDSSSCGASTPIDSS